MPKIPCSNLCQGSAPDASNSIRLHHPIAMAFAAGLIGHWGRVGENKAVGRFRRRQEGRRTPAHATSYLYVRVRKRRAPRCRCDPPVPPKEKWVCLRAPELAHTGPAAIARALGQAVTSISKSRSGRQISPIMVSQGQGRFGRYRSAKTSRTSGLAQ
jgi:hypothetical protein